MMFPRESRLMMRANSPEESVKESATTLARVDLFYGMAVVHHKIRANVYEGTKLVFRTKARASVDSLEYHAEAHEVVVTLVEIGTALVHLSYVVPGPTWKINYAAHVADDSLSFFVNLTITQNSDEDWCNVPVRLYDAASPGLHRAGGEHNGAAMAMELLLTVHSGVAKHQAISRQLPHRSRAIAAVNSGVVECQLLIPNLTGFLLPASSTYIYSTNGLRNVDRMRGAVRHGSCLPLTYYTYPMARVRTVTDEAASRIYLYVTGLDTELLTIRHKIFAECREKVQGLLLKAPHTSDITLAMDKISSPVDIFQRPTVGAKLFPGAVLEWTVAVHQDVENEYIIQYVFP